ncbi:MAG: hypothetical protein JWM95_1708 [Gemmatimonadetes bacterium]|nr:hypothetical protein [Gemmatimonadota bacterium]
MSSSISVSTAFTEPGFRRGDYISFQGMPSFAATTSGTAKGMDESGRRRITASAAGILTVRDPHRYRLVEWLHACAEDWILWPWADLKTRGARALHGVRS